MIKVQVANSKLVDILKKREVIHTEIGSIMEQLMKLDKDRTKLGYKMDKLKEKTKVIMDKLSPEVAEFEMISRIFLEGGEAYYEIIDLVEEYKQALRDKAKESK